jgi:hypothetical protein
MQVQIISSVSCSQTTNDETNAFSVQLKWNRSSFRAIFSDFRCSITSEKPVLHCLTFLHSITKYMHSAECKHKAHIVQNSSAWALRQEYLKHCKQVRKMRQRERERERKTGSEREWRLSRDPVNSSWFGVVLVLGRSNESEGKFEIRENGGEGAREIARVSIVCLVGNCGYREQLCVCVYVCVCVCVCEVLAHTLIAACLHSYCNRNRDSERNPPGDKHLLFLSCFLFNTLSALFAEMKLR